MLLAMLCELSHWPQCSILCMVPVARCFVSCVNWALQFSVDHPLSLLSFFRKKSVLDGSNLVFKDYIKRMKDSLNNDPPCPLCHRGFEDRSEVETLIEEVRPAVYTR